MFRSVLLRYATPLVLAIAAITLAQSPAALASQSMANTPERPDFAKISDVKEKKQQFFAYLRPRIEAVNKSILLERASLSALWTKSKLMALSDYEIAQLASVAKRYRLEVKAIDDAFFTRLLERVNVLPPALVMTQAANESAWGTSRFALEANNLFGQWCYSKGCGLVPKQRSAGQQHEVASFDDIQGSIESYFNNLNSHPAYQPLRDIRNQYGEDALLSVDAANAMARGLSKYSERGQAYIDELQAMMRHNKHYF